MTTTGPGLRQRHPTMAEAALAELQESILSGELAPGSPLRLEELAARLGMSISPVREAVRRLESLGLAVHVPHRGARVSAIAIDDLHDTYEVRLALEPLAVRRAAGRFTAEDAERARGHLEAYVSAYERDDARAARAAHAGFHFTLYEASGSEWLVRLIRPAWENCERYRSMSLQSRIWSDRRPEHERILAACAAREPERAASELARHLAATANLVARQMGAEELFPL
ncbi:MAG TPA: GntR family transcriptional regulator [Gaiellaceae bacterium]|nr:GntR family transcriptional regulator [Gaiellaceae bacterium]